MLDKILNQEFSAMAILWSKYMPTEGYKEILVDLLFNGKCDGRQNPVVVYPVVVSD